MLRFLYETALGRMLLKPLTSRTFSRIAGRFMDSRPSAALIRPFVRKNGIDLSEYQPAQYRTFNEFFTREIRPECRPVAQEGLMAPCDGLLSAYRITESLRIPVKGSVYSVSTLMGGDERADVFSGGTCLVFRLCVNHYHRYHFFDNCTPEPSRFIPGVLHTVRPIALCNAPVFHQNCREVTWMNTEHFGPAVQIEVGAMLVGRIQNHPVQGKALRATEKGRFLYGGSTIVLLLQKDAAQLPDSFFSQTENNQEIPVRYGERLDIVMKK